MPEIKFKNTIPSTLNVDYLRRIAGQTTFDLGKFYLQQGRVVSSLEDQGMIIAKVIGSDSYQVRLRIEGNNNQFHVPALWDRKAHFASTMWLLVWHALTKKVED